MGSEAAFWEASTLGSSLQSFSLEERYLKCSAVWSQSMAKVEEA